MAGDANLWFFFRSLVSKGSITIVGQGRRGYPNGAYCERSLTVLGGEFLFGEIGRGNIGLVVEDGTYRRICPVLRNGGCRRSCLEASRSVTSKRTLISPSRLRLNNRASRKRFATCSE